MDRKGSPSLSTYPVFFTPANEFDGVGFPLLSNGWCLADAFLDADAIAGVWVEPDSGPYREQFVATPNFVTDSGLIDGRRAQCFFNRSNVSATA